MQTRNPYELGLVNPLSHPFSVEKQSGLIIEDSCKQLLQSMKQLKIISTLKLVLRGKALAILPSIQAEK